MAHNDYTKTPDGIWALGEELLPEHVNDWERKMFQSINGDDGGLWSPIEVITISGGGVEIADAQLSVHGSGLGGGGIHVFDTDIRVGAAYPYPVRITETGIAAVGNNLDAGGISTAGGLSVTTNASIGGDLGVAGNLGCGGTLSVGGDITLTGAHADINGDVTITGDFSVTGGISVDGPLGVTGPVTVASPASVLFQAPLIKKIVQPCVPYAPGDEWSEPAQSLYPTALNLESLSNEPRHVFIPVRRPLHGAKLVTLGLSMAHYGLTVIAPEILPSITLIRQSLVHGSFAHVRETIAASAFTVADILFPDDTIYTASFDLSHTVDAETGTYWIRLEDAFGGAGSPAYVAVFHALAFTYEVTDLNALI